MSKLAKQMGIEKFREFVVATDEKLHYCHCETLRRIAEGRCTAALDFVCPRNNLTELGQVIFDNIKTYAFGWKVMCKNQKDKVEREANGSLFLEERRNFIRAINLNDTKQEAVIYLFWSFMLHHEIKDDDAIFLNSIFQIAKDMGISVHDCADIEYIVNSIYFSWNRTYQGSDYIREILSPVLLG